jgi:AraC-like DNA-binding protein
MRGPGTASPSWRSICNLTASFASTAAGAWASGRALLLTSLPPIIRIRADAPHARGLRSALELITFETEAARAGAAAIGGGLCSVVLVNILRAHLAADDRPHGWLGALSDRRIGGSLKLMHGNVARRWTINGLASEVGMSRTSFAQRFKSLVGMPPLEYLTRWRMTVARQALRREGANLAVIATSVGYESDTAFSLAFKRQFGGSPGRYRQLGRIGTPASFENATLSGRRSSQNSW